MDFVFLVLIALGLAMDAFAVSISCGIQPQSFKRSFALRVAFFFGLFQALMPVMGWAGGTLLQHYIKAVDHWLAFGLLAFIGSKMIYESRDSCQRRTNYSDFKVLFLLSIATSIDAFAVGMSFGFLKVSIFMPVIVIGSVTFIVSFLGVLLGDRIGCMFGKKIERIGGIILIGIGFKILFEHLEIL